MSAAKLESCLHAGQSALRLTAPDGAQATVLLHGAHVVSWRTPDGVERLYLSPQSAYENGRAVRGGVPVIFPQFEMWGPLPRHGFARTRQWQPVLAPCSAEVAVAVLMLRDDENSRSIWPHAFQAELTVSVGGERLDLELAVSHPATGQTADDALEFTAALHTYLRVDDVRRVSLQGLQRLRYRDSVNRTEQVDTNHELQVNGELDRIYFDSARPLRLHALTSEPSAALSLGGEVATIAAEGFRDVVVWNPGPEKCAQLSDMPPQGWQQMLCVEAACIGTPVRLAPGEEWVGRQTISCCQALTAAESMA
jgi:glucose-6-phosphate 1-epimerase